MVTRFGISPDEGLLKRFDRVIAREGHVNRSALVTQEWAEGPAETVGTITLVYSHDVRELADTLTDIQHGFHDSVISTMHIHLDGHNCLEVLVVRGRGRDIRKIADRLIGTKGVKHGKLTLATTGRDMA